MARSAILESSPVRPTPGGPGVARRDFLVALACCLAATQLPGQARAAAPAPALEALLRAMSALTGLPMSDAAQGQRYLDALAGHLGPDAIAALTGAAALPPADLIQASLQPPLRDTLEAACALWLTGVLPAKAGGAPQVLDFTGANVWRAVPFTKPPGYCGGAFGYWADPPARS